MSIYVMDISCISLPKMIGYSKDNKYYRHEI